MMMKRFIPEIQKLIKDKFNEKQKEFVQDLINGEFDRFEENYGILGIALGDELKEYSKDEIKSFHNIFDFEMLNTSDIMLTRVILTLTEKLGYDVQKEFEHRFTLCPSQPELIYLANLVYEQV